MSSTQDATEQSPLLAQSDSRQSSNIGNQEHAHNDAEANDQSTETESPEVLQARKNVKSMLPVLSIGPFLAILDQSIVAAINENIGSELRALHSVSWIATAYFLAMTCSQPLYGKLSDSFGRKPCLVFALTAFGIGSLGCGLTRSMPGLIAARAIQGIGGGGMLIVVTVLLSDVIPLRERGTYQGYLNLVGALGSTSGGPIGGLFAQTIGWRWVFLIQVVLCLVAILCVSLLLRLPSRKTESSVQEQLKRIDFLGALLLILTVFALLFGLDQGANVSWRSPITITPLCATLPLLIAFLWVEARFASAPFTPGHIIFDRALVACYATNFFGYAGFTALIFYLPMFFQVVINMTPAQAGAGLIPAAISAVVGTLLGGIILKRIGRFYWLALVASSVGALAAIPIAVAPSLHKGALVTIYVASIASFVPQGITVTSSLIAIISNVSPADQAVATACSFLFRSLGAAVGVSTVGLVIQEVLRIRLHDRLEREEAEKILRQIAKSLEAIKSFRPEVRDAVQECYAVGIQSGFIMCVVFFVLAAISVVWWRDKKMNK